MRHYENLVIVKPTLTEEEIKNTLALVEEVITSNGGEIIGRDAMGMKKLAYPIEKNVRGYFYVMYYTVAPSAISEIERRFRINEEILRFVT
ncbi:MAG: 30S ribosomal protein S6, partial [Sulfuricurvum sp.]